MIGGKLKENVSKLRPLDCEKIDLFDLCKLILENYANEKLKGPVRRY